MSKELEKAIAGLRDRDAGWVTRRDAAEALGRAAAAAVETLRAHMEDADQDVRRTVFDSLGRASAGLRGIKPITEAKTPSLRELVEACAKPGSREVTETRAGFDVRVTLKDGRAQVVHVEQRVRKDGIELVRVYTHCGKPTDDALRWALRTNMDLAQCALAIAKEEGGDVLVLTNSFLSGEVTPEEVKACVKEIAFYGDFIEQKTGKEDVF